ncbi:glutamate 5-kinase [Candidatus Woesearchaeota archaeon]|nr:glutamate 5-kinase [Candidatus Woesearchaeota archaeon]
MERKQLDEAKRIVIKIGTSILTDNEGNVDINYIRSIAKQISKLRKQGKEIIIVSSGAIGCGRRELGIKGKIRDIKLRQATAAVGQNLLMHDYHVAFKKFNQKVAQILITYESFFDRKTYLNLRSSVDTLLRLNTMPIINENDPLATDEIGTTFGDNDKLSALVASKVEADLLIMLTDIDGLYTKDPRSHKDAEIVRTVKKIDKKVKSYGGQTTSLLSRGGMTAKIDAAEIAMDAGCSLVIVNGKKKDILGKVINGEVVGTIFLPKEKIASKKRWIKQAPVKGSIIVDEGAKKAMLKGKNLLPAGILDVKGTFELEDVVSVVCGKKAFAKGIVDYSSEDLKKVKGKKTSQIKRMVCNLGADSSCTNVFTRENIVII